MNEQETDSQTEEKSTTPSTGSDGSDSENCLDTQSPAIKDGPAVVGEMILRLYENEVITASFITLGRWTPGRLEKAMPIIFRECMARRQAFGRQADGLPERFNTGGEGIE